jgi:hypothetical protein
MADGDQRAVSNRLDGWVLGTSVQAGVVHGDLRVSVPEALATDSASEHRTQVLSLVRAQVRAAQDLPRLLPGARRPALADVYVRQDLGSSLDATRSEPQQPTPILDGRDQFIEVPTPPAIRIVARPPVRTVRDVLDGNDHLVVTGGAGQGKSTLSLRLAADIAAHWLDNEGGGPLAETVVPLRLTARSLATRLDQPFPEALAESVRADYGALLWVPISPEVLCDRVAGCRWLLLVDGLDEVADADDRDRLVKVLASWTAESPYRVLLTTRPIEGAVLAPLQRIGAVRYELQPFDDEALRRFAENWFAEEGCNLADRFLRQIRAAHLDNLVRVPLLATIAAIVFQLRSDMPLPDNEYELYEHYFAFLCSARPIDSPFDPHRIDLLEHLGTVRVETDTALAAAARDWVRCHMAVDQLPADWPDHLTSCLVAVGPLVMRGNDLMFLHHSFAEHLAATATARRLPTTFVPGHEDFAQLLHAARPKERGRFARAAALHYTRLHPDQADPLLRCLHGGDAEQHLLAARLLAKRMPATTPPVNDFLAAVRGWAVTTHVRAGDILSYACRATQHPGLAEWLIDLMRDENASWPSRTEAAAALSVRLRDDRMPDAIRFLTALIDNPQVDVAVRLAAAEALSDSGTAERETAERGLRSVLDDDAGSGTDYRTAAVILASFDRDASEFAVSALTRRLADPATAPEIVVELATGLIEIGAEFHERAAGAFRLVLHDRVHDATGREDAALGLASLGPDHLAEAAAALTAVVGDRRRTRAERGSAASVLGRLGPQHRQAAGRSVQAMLTEPDITGEDIRYCAAELASFGPAFRDEAEHRLRALIADRGCPISHVMAALNDLGRLGAEHLPEVARRSWELLDEVRPDMDEYTTILGRLTKLAEPHRTTAIERLRAHLADGCASATSRGYAASWLISAGPGHHADVARQLLSIAEGEPNPAAGVAVWTELVKLGPQFHDRALDALLRAADVGDAEPVVWFSRARDFASSEGDRDLIADAMTAVIRDTRRTFRARLSGLAGLLWLGPRFHRRAVTELCALYRAAPIEFDFRYAATIIARVGAGLRAEVADVLFDLMADPMVTIPRTHLILFALETLGFTGRPAARAALRTVAEHAENTFQRLDAESMLLAVDPSSAPAIADDVFASEGGIPDTIWQRVIGQLADLGIDVTSRLTALIADSDMDRRARWASAVYLAKAFPLHRDRAIAELEAQLASRYLRPTVRAAALYEFAEVEPTARDRVIDGLAVLVGDERLRIDERCESAYYCSKMDRSTTPGVFAFLGRVAEDPRLTPAERAESVDWMRRLGSRYTVSPQLLAFAALDSGDAELRRSLFGALPREVRTKAERVALDDRALLFGDRAPQFDVWDDMPLAAQLEAAAREVLVAPEFSWRERIDAAMCLAWDVRTVSEAVAYLDSAPADSPVARRARWAVMTMQTARGLELRRDAECIVQDQGLPLRLRSKAAKQVLDVVPKTPRSLVGVLREIVADPGTSHRGRVEAMIALERFDGLGALRAIRDDVRTPGVVRQQAAYELTEYEPDDNAVAVAIYRAIADDPDERPPLRVRVAGRLAACGQEGRDLAVGSLRTIMADTRLPIGSRAEAATTLGTVAPNTRSEVLAMLRAMLSTDKPLLRRMVLLAIGEMRPEEAALDLLAMARDERLSAVPRVWCAEGAVSLWRPGRDAAAVVVRAIASDVEVAPHVRRQAACFLARWSEVCREEARQLIRELDG